MSGASASEEGEEARRSAAGERVFEVDRAGRAEASDERRHDGGSIWRGLAVPFSAKRPRRGGVMRRFVIVKPTKERAREKGSASALPCALVLARRVTQFDEWNIIRAGCVFRW